MEDKELRLFVERFYKYLMEAVKESKDFDEFKARMSLLNLKLISDRLGDLIEKGDC